MTTPAELLDREHPSVERLHLANLEAQNEYIERAVYWYLEALAQHERGEDIDEYLHLLNWHKDESFFGNSKHSLNEDERAFILEGRGSPEPNYHDRLACVVSDISLGSPRYRQTYEAYQDGRSGDLSTDFTERVGRNMAFFEHTDRLENANRITSDLDEMFEADGKRPDQLDKLHVEMIDLCLQLNEPELASYFVDQIDDLELRMSLYFRSIETVNTAAFAILERLGDMRQALQDNPQMLCEFLIGEISIFGDRVANLETNVEEVLTLSSDPAIYSQTESLPNANYIRLRLAKALMSVKPDLAEEVMRTIPVDAGSYHKEFYDWKTRSLALKGQLSRKQRRELKRKIRKSRNEVDKKHYQEKLDLDREKKDEANGVKAESKPYSGPRLSDTMSVRNNHMVRLYESLSLDGHEQSERVYHEILASPRCSNVEKSLAAVAMAATFERTSEQQDQLVSQVNSSLDVLAKSLPISGNPHADIVDRSEYRQGVNADTAPVFKEIGCVIDPVTRLELLARFAEIQVVQDTSAGSVWNDLRSQVQQTYAQIVNSGEERDAKPSVDRLSELGIVISAKQLVP